MSFKFWGGGSESAKKTGENAEHPSGGESAEAPKAERRERFMEKKDMSHGTVYRTGSGACWLRMDPHLLGESSAFGYYLGPKRTLGKQGPWDYLPGKAEVVKPDKVRDAISGSELDRYKELMVKIQAAGHGAPDHKG